MSSRGQFWSNFGGRAGYYTSFGSKAGQPLSTVVASRIVKLKTIPVDSVLTIVGGEYQINGGSWVSIAGTLDPTDTIKVRLTSSASYLTGSTCTATINGVAYTFTVTTLALVTSMGLVDENGAWLVDENGANLVDAV